MEKIEKKIGHDGEVCYFQKNGDEVMAVGETLEELFYCVVDPFEMLFELLQDECEEACYIGQALVRDARQRFMEAHEFIEREFGTVFIDRASYGQRFVEGRKMLGVSFKPINGKEDRP